jgi:hypothetical protein
MAEHEKRDSALENRESPEIHACHAEGHVEPRPASSWQAYSLDTLILFLDS